MFYKWLDWDRKRPAGRGQILSRTCSYEMIDIEIALFVRKGHFGSKYKYLSYVSRFSTQVSRLKKQLLEI